MNDEIAKRLERLESHVAHLEQQHDQLNQVVIAQGKLLKKLALQSQRLADSVEASESERIRSTNPKPPHYQ